MDDPKRVILSNDLVGFFRDEVAEAKDNLGIKLPELTEYYVVNLLCDFSRPEAGLGPGDEPLALLYKRALEAGLAERAQLLKQLGDVSLYVSGFFVEFIERSLVDLDYYISMGGQAYSSLSSLVGHQSRGDKFAELYDELARRFTMLVDLLHEIAAKQRESGRSDTELLRLYDRWARTGSHRIRKLLLERGLLPPEGLPTDYLQ